MRLILLLSSVAALAASNVASAATVFSDGFETDTPALALTALNNFSVAGNVDVVGASNGFGIVAPSNVVDLDGTTGPGAITSQSFGFAANRQITLSFVLGGAQRRSVADQFSAGFVFAGPTQLNNYTLGGGYGSTNLGNLNLSDITSFSVIPGAAPYTNYSISFSSGNAGSLTFNIGTLSADNTGPLLDSVTLDISAVPEPATWGLMIAGFGMVGFAARRRRSTVAA